MAQMIADLAGCDLEEAAKAYAFFNGDIAAAVDFLLPTTSVSGDSYIPAKPTVDTGMDAEQSERCAKGRDLQDKVNSIFSAAAAQGKSSLLEEVVSVPTMALPDEPAPPASPESSSG